MGGSNTKSLRIKYLGNRSFITQGFPKTFEDLQGIIHKYLGVHPIFQVILTESHDPIFNTIQLKRTKKRSLPVVLLESPQEIHESFILFLNDEFRKYKDENWGREFQFRHIRLQNNVEYIGELEQGLPGGFGYCKWDQGEIHEGFFENGQPNGPGLRIYANQDKYEGHFWHGKRHGVGKLYLSNGDTVQGMFVNDVCDETEYSNIKHGVTYKGKLHNWNPMNRGSIEYQNGDKYEGSFQGWLKDGKGTYYWDDGRVFKGQYQNDKRHGKGYYFKNGEVIKQEWSNGFLTDSKYFKR